MPPSPRPHTSLDHVQGEAPATEAQIRVMAAKAREAGVIMFLREDLKRLPWSSREIIEAEAARLYGRHGQ